VSVYIYVYNIYIYKYIRAPSPANCTLKLTTRPSNPQADAGAYADGAAKRIADCSSRVCAAALDRDAVGGRLARKRIAGRARVVAGR